MATTLTKAVTEHLLTRGKAVHRDLRLWRIHIRCGAYGCRTAFGAEEVTVVSILCGDDGENNQVIVCWRRILVTWPNLSALKLALQQMIQKTWRLTDCILGIILRDTESVIWVISIAVRSRQGKVSILCLSGGWGNDAGQDSRDYKDLHCGMIRYCVMLCVGLNDARMLVLKITGICQEREVWRSWGFKRGLYAFITCTEILYHSAYENSRTELIVFPLKWSISVS